MTSLLKFLEQCDIAWEGFRLRCVDSAVDVHDRSGGRGEPVREQCHAGPAAGAVSSTSQPSGARSFQTCSKPSKPGIDFAAIVRSGPAATRLTRTPCGRAPGRGSARSTRPPPSRRPSSRTPATREWRRSPVLRSSRRSPINGKRGAGERDQGYVEICSAVETSLHGASKNPPPSAVAGAKPIACSTPSRWSACSRTASASPSSSALVGDIERHDRRTVSEVGWRSARSAMRCAPRR